MMGVLSAVTVPLRRARAIAVKMVLNCILSVREYIRKGAFCWLWMRSKVDD
jgi:hypothetical protein